VVPNLKELLAKRAGEALRLWLARNPASPYKGRDDIQNSGCRQDLPTLAGRTMEEAANPPHLAKWGEYLAARQQLLVNLLKANG